MPFHQISRISAALVAAFAIAGSAKAVELIQNPFFADNVFGSTAFNMDNAIFNQAIANCTAFGTAQEIDLVYGAAFGPPPPVGNTKLGLHTQFTGNFDAFSTTLLNPLVAGGTYRLQVYSVHQTGAVTDLQIGMSNSPTSFGTLVQTVPNSGSWLFTEVDVVAPLNGQYLTFRPDPSVLDGYVALTGLSLVNIALPNNTPKVRSLVAHPRTIRNRGRSEITVTLERPAPPGGATYPITYSSAALQGPTQVFVSGNKRTAKFIVFGHNPTTTNRRVDVRVGTGNGSLTTSILVTP